MNPNPSRPTPDPKDQARWRKAQEQLLSGRFGPALAAYRELVRRNPRVAELWFELGNAAGGELQFEEADRAYRKALDLAPGNSSLASLIGHQYQGLRRLDEARECFERAVAVNPGSVDARINLAVWFEKERRLDEAWDQVEACRARHPRDDQVRYFRAFLLHRRKDLAQAEFELRALIGDQPRYPYVRYSARHLLGVVLDELGQYEEAFRWLGEAKAIVRTITDTKALERGYDGATRLRREAMESLTPAILRRWRDEGPASDEGYRFAFLGGHPRSGTTLIEQILDAHPRITGFDEPVAFLQEVTRRLPGAAGLAALDGLSTAARATMRNRYTASLLREVAPPGSGSLLLDKNPSPTASLDVWLRLFPEMKVVVALRDPRDVVISCYFLNIMLNATNVNFLSLERTVKHYTDLMGSWLRMKEIGGFDWIETRYEDVVGSLDTEGRKVTSFLGLDWHPDQGRYHETARRKVLYAPTYHDVTQPVYRRAVGRWSRYAEALEPFRETLAPFCRAFGYCW